MSDGNRDALVDALRWIAEGHCEDLEGTAPGSTPGNQRVGADARNVAKAALKAVEADPLAPPQTALAVAEEACRKDGCHYCGTIAPGVPCDQAVAMATLMDVYATTRVRAALEAERERAIEASIDRIGQFARHIREDYGPLSDVGKAAKALGLDGLPPEPDDTGDGS